jgi:hypothetical protein
MEVLKTGLPKRVRVSVANPRFRRSIARALLSAGLVALAVDAVCGCTWLSHVESDVAESTQVHVLSPDRPVYGVTEARLSDRSLAGKNEDALAEYRQEEWPLNKSGMDRPPQYGWAMSGGGIRSAAFNMGVLSALAQLPDGAENRHQRFIDRFDVISAVSGGSYTASWYYLQHEKRGHTDEDDFRSGLFDPSKKYQEYLAEHASVLPLWLEAVAGTLDVVTSPWNLVANGLFGWHANTSPGELVYRSRIHRAFQRDPDGEDLLDPDGHAVSFPELGREISSKDKASPLFGLPLPILNASALIEDDPEHYGSRLSNADFEFTPFHYGSDAFVTASGSRDHPQYQYLQYDGAQPLDITKGVAVSGAALDATYLIAGPSQKTLVAAMNFDWGYYIPNPLVSKGTRELHYWLPFPAYFVHHYLRDSQGVRIYLSDGGFADNLGAFPLIRRLTDHIVIVDAEYDPDYVFESYFKLKAAVLAEFGANLVVPGIDALQCSNQEGAKCATCARFDKIQPIMTGTVESFPWPGKPRAPRKTLKVLYIKLWASDVELGKFDREGSGDVWAAWNKSADTCGPLPAANGCFPQDPTIDQHYTPEKFKAYRELGFYLVKSHQEEVERALR